MNYRYFERVIKDLLIAHKSVEPELKGLVVNPSIKILLDEKSSEHDIDMSIATLHEALYGARILKEV